MDSRFGARVSRLACASAAVFWLLGIACNSEPTAKPASTAPTSPPKPSAAPVQAAPAKVIPVLPPVPDLSRESACVVAHWDSQRPTWVRRTLRYDAAKRTLDAGTGPMRFDAHGLLIERGDKANGGELQSYKYDSHGNLLSWTAKRGNAVVRQVRWTLKYEGKKPRLRSSALDFTDAARAPTQPQTQREYRYDETTGSLAEETVTSQTTGSTRKFAFTDGKVNVIESRQKTREQDTAPGIGAREDFTFDEAGRLVQHTQDGSLDGEPVASDGKPDQIERFQYDAEGHLMRVDVDGVLGGVGPQGPDDHPETVEAFSPACTEVGKLWPAIFRLPDLRLPAGLAPAWLN